MLHGKKKVHEKKVLHGKKYIGKKTRRKYCKLHGTKLHGIKLHGIEPHGMKRQTRQKSALAIAADATKHKHSFSYLRAVNTAASELHETPLPR